MDKMLNLLESFTARGNDGKSYSVHVYEHLARVELIADGQDHWEPTGQSEYKLADGRPLTVDANGAMRLPGTELRLTRQ